jgi:hypothetical protein
MNQVGQTGMSDLRRKSFFNSLQVISIEEGTAKVIHYKEVIEEILAEIKRLS